MADVNVVEQTVKRLSSHKGIEGILILSGEGIPIRSTLESSLSVQYAGLVSLQESFSALMVHAEDTKCSKCI